MCAEVTRRSLPMTVFDTEEVRRGAFSVYGYQPLIGYCVRHSPFSPSLLERLGGKAPPADDALSSEAFNFLIQAVDYVKKADNVTTLVELHVILLADFDAIDGVITGAKGQRQRSLSLHVPDLAEIVYLIEGLPVFFAMPSRWDLP